MKQINKEFLFMVVFNFIIILLAMIYGLKHKGESKIVNYNETNTYVQYIERSDNENHLPIAGITTEEIYNMMPDQSLSEDTSLTDVTVTDSCQEISTYPEFTYSLDISEQDKYLLAKINECEAGNQNIETRMLVVLTVLNRVKSDKFPDTIEEVIKENRNGIYQFSPLTQGGSWYDTEPTEEAYIAVDNVLNSMYDYSGGALYFESCEDEDNWHSRNLEYLYQSGDIRFYK